MSLQFIVGSAGSGKSTFLYQKLIKEAMADPGGHYLVIVPEQFTLATQQQLVAMHPSHVIMNIDVLSFQRLAYRVFDELGTDTLEVLEETGKQLLLRKVAQEQEENLGVLRKNMKRPGYLMQMKSLISELSQYDISPEEFQQHLKEPAISPALYQKAQDILIMYRGFCEKMQGTYLTAEGILQKLMEVAPDSAVLGGATMVFDGFTGFTPIQNQLLQTLMPLTKKMLFTVTCDIREPLFGKIEEQELFAMSREMVRRLTALASQVGILVEDVIYQKGQGRFVPGGMLQHLEQNLFRQTGRTYRRKAGEDAIEIAGLSNPRQELLYVAAEIERQVRKKHMRYRDFAVVCADMEQYAYLAPQVFWQLHIPCFLDTRSEITFHPLIETLSSLFALPEENFSYESVMRHLRAGMSGLSVDEVDELENYLLAAGIRGEKKYREIFAVIPRGYTPEQLVMLNELRERFYRPVAEFLSGFPRKRGTVRDISEALYHFCRSYQMEEQLMQQAEEFRCANDEVRAREYEQIYGIVMDLLDKLVFILGEEEVSLGEYGEILSSGFESVSIGTIPPGNDQVLVGDLERSRQQQIKVLYLIGANDGAIPKAMSHGGILSQPDRQSMKAAHMEVAPTDRERAFMQRFYLYLVMTKPSEKLVVTYSRINHEGRAIRKSYLIRSLLKMFPFLKEEVYETLPVNNRLLTRETAAEYYVEGLRSFAAGDAVPEDFWPLAAWEWERDKEKQKRLMEGAFYFHKEETLSRAAVDAVFGNEMQESVSRLEQYARCAYSYFLKYGLKLMPRQEYSFEKADMGNLYHMALEYYSKGIQKMPEVNWYTITREESDALLKEAVRHTYQTMTKTQALEDARDLFFLHRMEQTLRQTVWALQEQVRKGSFVPSAFEVDLKEVGDLDALTYQLDEMHRLRLQGKVDRVDLWEKEDKVYVKIVDYKSGSKDLDMNQLYHGLQVQLVLYMDAVSEGLQKQYPNRQVEPGAMFYYHIDRPVVEAEACRGNDSSRQILKELRMRGVVNRDDVVIDALHHGLEGTSDVIPVGRKKDGTPSSRSHVLSGDEMRLLGDYTKMQMAATGEQILQGKIDCSPCRLGDFTGCTYCDYHGICGFDSSLEGFSYRRLSQEDNAQEVMQKMKDALRRNQKQEGDNS